MPDIAQQLHQHKFHLWSSTTDRVLFEACGIEVPQAGISYSIEPFESLHGDQNFYSLCYVSEGQARIVLGGESFSVSRGDVVLYPRGTSNAIYPDPEQPWEWCWIIIGGEPIDRIIHQCGWLAHPCPLMTTTDIPFVPITQAIMQAFHVQPYGSLHVGGLLLQLLGYLARIDTAVNVVLPRSDIEVQVTEIISYMGRHLAVTLTLDSLAAHFCLSPSQVGKLFRRVTGISPIQYFKYLRIETAKGLLRSTQSIHHIAAQVGFDDVVTFDRAFKRLTGMTPRQFRRQLHG
jgi:AraC family transcriptional regulator of arabinose operon